jgi:hypothetical protein
LTCREGGDVEQQGFVFRDRETGDEGYCSVRIVGDAVGVATSVATGGDLEVFLAPADAQKLAELLLKAASQP